MRLRIGILLCLGGSAHVEGLSHRIALTILHLDAVEQLDGIPIDMDCAGVLSRGGDDTVDLILDVHLYGHVGFDRRAFIIEGDVEERGVRQTFTRIGIGAVALPLHALVQLFDGLVPQGPVLVGVALDLTHSHARADREIGFPGVGNGDDVLVILEGEGTGLGFERHDTIDREGFRSEGNGSLAVDRGVQQISILPGDMYGLHVRRFFHITQRLIQLDLHLDRCLGLNLVLAGFVHDGDIEEPRLFDGRQSARQNTLGIVGFICRGFFFRVRLRVHRIDGLFTISLIIFAALDNLLDDQLSVIRNLRFRSEGKGNQEGFSVMSEIFGLKLCSHNRIVGEAVVGKRHRAIGVARAEDLGLGRAGFA